ncbi:MAG: Glu/Leu/Phe/Val dehydrogenase dimerization domain-containing protein [Pseudobdellovibrionaceae bacterium]|jgi:leucine dehydrogenase|nr:Glu/Leu/Phe/Val dehydrogenase dimerization domain-containing protein [Pseudobdellovibrionaceae bacterium]
MLMREDLDVSIHPSFDNHEKVVMFTDQTTGLRAVIAVHNTNLGPSLGGCRIYPYADINDAVTDVLRLSKGMTYKSALAGLPLGGGKAVIIGNPREIKKIGFMQSFGEAVEQMGGSYITAEDVGSTEEDMIEISKTTSYVAGLPETGAGEGVAGNPSPVTAYGVYCGLKACTREKYRESNLKGRKIAIQGMGAVGYELAEYLAKDGAELWVADIHQDVLDRAQQQFGAQVHISPASEIHKLDVDIFAPCALGAGLNDRTIPEIKAEIIGGAANNQLAERRHDEMLREKGIIYAPDYAINSGGITSVGYEYFWRTERNPYQYELTRDTMMSHVSRIEETLGRVFTLADNKAIGTGEAADQLAEEIFKAGPSTQTSVA